MTPTALQRCAIMGLGLLVVVPLAGCKPPPTDADMGRDIAEPAPRFAAAPLPSPDTTGAIWARSPNDSGRLIYGVPEQPALRALECTAADSELPMLQITRLSPADRDAGALLALVGNGHIGRIAVDARDVNGRLVWQGEAAAADTVWEPLAGPRALGVTVPGAGRVAVNPSIAAMAFIEDCRRG